MSIVVGKRNFAENFSKMMISDFPQDSLYRSKLIMNEATISNRNFPLAANQAHFLENAKLLKQNFQHIDEKEIVTVLDDCDNNLEIAMEILQKSAQQNFNPNIQASVQGRTLKKIQTSKDSQKKANTNVQKPEEKKLEPMREEEPVNEQKVEEVMNLSANVIAMLQSLNSMDEAQDWMARFILEVKDETEKKNQTTIKKLKEEKAILVKAFAKQRQKAHVDEVKNEELNNRLTTQDQEIGNLKMINYNLGLRLRALDTNDNENHNFDVY